MIHLLGKQDDEPVWELFAFIARLFNPNARIVQAEAAMKMSMDLVHEYRQRLETVEQQMAEYRDELDTVKSDHLQANGTIADLQRRLKASEAQLKTTSIQLKANAERIRLSEEKERSYEATIRDLKSRIAELEGKLEEYQRGSNT